MLKIRLYFIDDEEGREELERGIENLEKNFEIISRSKVYNNSKGSKYSRVYLDVKNKYVFKKTYLFLIFKKRLNEPFLF